MITSLLVVLLIGAIAWIGAGIGLASVFVALPYLAVAIFIAGVAGRMVYWSKSPVPFAIPTTGGQQTSLEWIKPAGLDNPSTKWGVVKRMFLEVFLFRSLFRNTYAEVSADGPRVSYFSSKWLWFFALLFHYCFLLVFIRHFRFFLEPVPACLTFMESVDGMLQVGAPRMYLTGVLLLCAVLFLLCRRLFNERLRYISLMNDYFPLFLILGIVVSGILLRYYIKTDIASVKAFTMGLVTLSPAGTDVTGRIGNIFFVHLTYVSVLLMYFPFSKLVHAPGVFFSPTRNLPNNTRAVHHENPWNDPNAPFTTYAEYEDNFRDVMAEAGLPLEKQPAKAAGGDKE